MILQHIVAKSSAISFTRRAARYTSQRGKRLEIGDFLPSESACEERPWKSPSPRADFLKLAGVRVARGSGAFVLKDLLPGYASQCAWVVARLPVHVVTLLKFSELARGVQSPHKDENPSPDMKQVGRVQFACGQMDDDPLQQRIPRVEKTRPTICSGVAKRTKGPTSTSACIVAMPISVKPTRSMIA